jgi:hypothetical protein
MRLPPKVVRKIVKTDKRAPGLRLPPLRLRTTPTELEDSPQAATNDELGAFDFSSETDQDIDQDTSDTAPDAWPLTSSMYTTYSYPSISSLPRSPASHSSANSHDGVTSPTGSYASSISRPPTLRRKISPTETSLREIRASQQRLQMMQSEDRLRQLYEQQTMEYLHGDFANLDGLRE